MKVLAYDPYLPADAVRARGAEKVELDELMRALRLRLDQLPADAGDPQPDRRDANSR